MKLADVKVNVYIRIDKMDERKFEMVGDLLLKAKPRYMPDCIYSFFTRRILALDWGI